MDNSGPHQFITHSLLLSESLSPSITLALSSPITVLNHITLKICRLKTQLFKLAVNDVGQQCRSAY